MQILHFSRIPQMECLFPPNPALSAHEEMRQTLSFFLWDLCPGECFIQSSIYPVLPLTDVLYTDRKQGTHYSITKN